LSVVIWYLVRVAHLPAARVSIMLPMFGMITDFYANGDVTEDEVVRSSCSAAYEHRGC
jgi:hypothetical protein